MSVCACMCTGVDMSKWVCLHTLKEYYFVRLYYVSSVRLNKHVIMFMLACLYLYMYL